MKATVKMHVVSTQSVPETTANSPSPVLPEEVIVEILLRVPIRSLVKFRCVSKSWKTLISDPQFVNNQFQISTTKSYPQLVSSVFNKDGRPILVAYNVDSLLENHPTNLTDTEPENTIMIDNHYMMLGSCNGLFCLFENCRNFVMLYNPILNLISRKSPTHVSPFDEDFSIVSYHGFGYYDQVNGKYKVLIGFSNFSETVTNIYTSGENCWRTIQNFPRDTEDGILDNRWLGKFVSGTLNWIVNNYVDNSDMIISFDLEKETYGEVLLPQYDSDGVNNVVTDVLSNFLCLCFDYDKNHFVVWLMKDYGVVESWTKLMIIPHLNVTMTPSFVDPLFISVNSTIIVKTMRDLYRWSSFLIHKFTMKV